MKRIYSILCILAIPCIGYYACHKAGNSLETFQPHNKNPQLAAIITAKRDFYNSLMTMKGTTIESTQGGSRANPIKSWKDLPLDRAKILRLSGRDVILVLYFSRTSCPYNRISAAIPQGSDQHCLQASYL